MGNKIDNLRRVVFSKNAGLDTSADEEEIHSYIVSGWEAERGEASIGDGIAKIYTARKDTPELRADEMGYQKTTDHVIAPGGGAEAAIRKAIELLEKQHDGFKLTVEKLNPVMIRHTGTGT